MGEIRARQASHIAGAIRLDAPARPGLARRWTTAIALALAIHAAPLLLMVIWPVTSPPLALAPDQVIYVELSRPAVPAVPPPERLRGPERLQPRPPRPLREIAPLSPDVPPLIVPAGPTEPLQKAREPGPEAAAAPDRPPPPPPRPAGEPSTWESRLLGALNKHKRFPREAQARRQQGAPYIRFVIDRQGKVLSSVLERSSGHRALDAEAVALPRRAQPLPPPPDDVPGATVELVVPVEFFIR